MPGIDNKKWEARRSDNGNQRSGEYRSAFMRDECRVVHSFGFRRLQGKTQIFGPEQGDFHRTRLTHSIEVASIGKSIASHLKHLCLREKNKNVRKYHECHELLGRDDNNYDYLITAIGLLHDIGHPPFGHAGEIALNYKMHKYGGFEGNAQTIRLLTALEDYTENFGLDLTRRTLLGLLKYPAPYNELCAKYPAAPARNRDIEIDCWIPPKCYYDDENMLINGWLLKDFEKNDKINFSNSKKNNTKDEKRICHKKTKYKSFDCSIMDIADDIAYSMHDMEDAIHFGLVQKDDLKDHNLSKLGIDKSEDLFSDKHYKRKKVFSQIIHELIRRIGIEQRDNFQNPLLKYYAKLDKDAANTVKDLKNIINEKVIKSQEVENIVFSGMMTVMQLFDAIKANPDKLLPKEYMDKFSPQFQQRTVCDYIAGMTDEYARRMHERIYGDYPRSILERL